MYLLRRVGIFGFSVLIASMLVFSAMSILPGNQARVMLGTQATDEKVAALETELGLDRPIPVQYLDWLSGAVRGDLGESVFTGQPIWDQIVDRLKVTIPLAVLAMGLVIAIGFPAGILAASRHRKPVDTIISTLSQIGLAVPAFWAGLMLISYFAVARRWFPANGFPGWDNSVADSIEALILPAVALALVQGAVITRYVRSAVLDTLREDYLRTARAKGLTRISALWRHGLRNAMIPVLTVLGMQFAALIAGTVVIESVFVLPGLGTMLLQAISKRDLLLVQGGALVIVVCILGLNLLIDLAYRFIDPRVART